MISKMARLSLAVVMIGGSYLVSAQQTNDCIGVTNVEYNNSCSSGGNSIGKFEYNLNGNPFMISCTSSSTNTKKCSIATSSTSGVTKTNTIYDCDWNEQGSNNETVSAKRASCG